jgi:hypothetical protein
MLTPLVMSNELHYWFTAKTRSSVAGSSAELAWRMAVCMALRVATSALLYGQRGNWNFDLAEIAKAQGTIVIRCAR